MADYSEVLRDLAQLLHKIASDIEQILPKEVKKLDQQEPEKILVSCDGSILKNPGGRCTIGAVIQVPDNAPIEIAQFTPSSTNNEAEFDAIYVGLSNAGTLRPDGTPIVVESDSKLVIDSLNGECQLKETRLVKKRDLILELAANLPGEVSFTWKRRNSTSGLKKANLLAQSLNGVKPH